MRIETVLCSLLCSLVEAAGAETDHAWVRREFERQIVPRVEVKLAEPASNATGGIAWSTSYDLDALARMLEATGEPKYADLFIRLARHVCAARDSLHGRKDLIRDKIVPGWGSTKYTNGQWYVWAVHTGMITEPLARFAWVVRQRPALRSRYGAEADEFLKVAEDAVAVHDDQFREGPGDDEGYLYGLYTKRNLPLNMQNALARAWMSIDDATGRRVHRERVTKLARFFKKRLRAADDGAYVWDYRPPLDGPGAGFEDISHASINVAFAVQCFEHGIVFNRKDIENLVRTLLDHVLTPDGRFVDRVGGKAGYDHYRPAALRWSVLARHDPRVRERLLRIARLPEFGGDAPDSIMVGLAMLYDGETPMSEPATMPR